MKITVKMLREKGACDYQLKVFRTEWPRGVTVTTESLTRAIELNLNIDWAAKTFLPAQAWAEYERVKAQARAEYERVKAQARAEYERVEAQAFLATIAKMEGDNK